MFGLGMTEIILILVIALLVIGPKKLPEVAKALGKGYGEFKRAMSDFKEAVNIDLEEENKNKKENEDLADIYEDKWKKNIENEKAKNDVVFNNDKDNADGVQEKESTDTDKREV